MSYADQQGLSADTAFQNRMWSALATEAVVKPSDPLVDLILLNPFDGVTLFMPFIATAPGFGDMYAAGGQEAITDGDMLAAVQAAWPRVQVPA